MSFKSIQIAVLHSRTHIWVLFLSCTWCGLYVVSGNTAVYLLYAYARICAIFRKAGVDSATLKIESLELEDPHERQLALQMLRLYEIINSCLDDLHLHRYYGELSQNLRWVYRKLFQSSSFIHPHSFIVILSIYPFYQSNFVLILSFSRIAEYMYDLSGAFTSFYQNCKVIGSQNESSRLLLCELTRRFLEVGTVNSVW